MCASLTSQLKKKDEIIQKYEERAKDDAVKKIHPAASVPSVRVDADASQMIDPHLGIDRPTSQRQMLATLPTEEDRARDDGGSGGDSTANMHRRNLMKDLFTPLRTMFEGNKLPDPSSSSTSTTNTAAVPAENLKDSAQRNPSIVTTNHGNRVGKRESSGVRDRSATTMSLLFNPQSSSLSSSRVRARSPPPGSSRAPSRPASTATSSTATGPSTGLTRSSLPITSPTDKDSERPRGPWKCSTCLHLNTHGHVCELCTEPAPVTAHGSSEEEDLTDRLILLSKRKHESFDENEALSFGRRLTSDLRSDVSNKGEETRDSFLEDADVRRTRSDFTERLQGSAEGQEDRESEFAVFAPDGVELDSVTPLSSSTPMDSRSMDQGGGLGEKARQEDLLRQLRRIRELLREAAEVVEREEIVVVTEEETEASK
jgi:hypothetical protein